MITMEEIEIIMDVVDMEWILTRKIDITMIELIEVKMDSSEETTKLIEIRDHNMVMIKKEISLLEIIFEGVIEMIIEGVLFNKYYKGRGRGYNNSAYDGGSQRGYGGRGGGDRPY